jgi:16S rRNA (guanine527-N7)-methyltransferase
MKNSSLKEILINGLQQMDINLPIGAEQQLLDYLALLHKWNQAYNLTAVDEPKEMVVRHLLDCLAVLPVFPETSPILDVGSGAGLPGIVLAIARPEQQFYLLDSLGKRTIFLEKVVRDLKLKQVTVINSRVEQYQPGFEFAVITSRAYSSLSTFLETTRHLANENTLYLALKGRLQIDEISDIKNEVIDFKSHALTIPNLNAERHVITFYRKP